MKAQRWLAVFGLSFSLLCSMAGAAEKQLKEGESELYNVVLKNLTDMDFAKALTSLNAWQKRVPDSDFKDERSAFFVQAYAGANQPAQALDAATGLISKDLKDLSAAFTGLSGQAMIIRLLYNSAWAISRVANPTAAELETGEKAARQLMAYDQPLPGVTPEKWAEARADMRAKAEAALVYIASLPGIQAMAKQPPDCLAAESAYTRALALYPGKAALSWQLGIALNCEAKMTPDKLAPAVYEFVRAATLDPSLGDAATDPKKIQAFADNAYVRLHGSIEGLDQLRAEVKQSPVPPPNFAIQTASEIAEAKFAEFEKDHPELALWMKIKEALSAGDGQSYFESQLKDSAVPKMQGILIDAKPACRPKELLVAVPLPDTKQPLQPEITLKLDKPLNGKPDLNSPLYWEAVPSAFSATPFMLTMDAAVTAIQGLNTTPCRK